VLKVYKFQICLFTPSRRLSPLDENETDGEPDDDDEEEDEDNEDELDSKLQSVKVE
jgi:hypothetical protein